MKAGFRPEEVDHLRDQLEFFVARQIVDLIDGSLDQNLSISRFQDDVPVTARFDAHARAQRKREIDGRRAGMKQIQRPDVNGAARQIATRRC